MALIRWNPDSDLMSLHSEMDRLFNEVTQGFGLIPATRLANGRAGGQFLPVDIARTDGAITVHASVPGFAPEEVEVTIDGGVLTIDARHEAEGDTADGGWVRRERYSGRLHRQISLGEDTDADGVQASFANGVLTVTVPLTRRPEPRRIPVSSVAQPAD